MTRTATQKWATRITAALGGGVATGTDVLVLVAAVASHLPLQWAIAMGVVAGGLASFLWSRNIVFARGAVTGRPFVQLGRFAVVVAVTALVMAWSMPRVITWLGCSYVVAKALCAPTVFLAWSYPAQKHWVFPAPQVPVTKEHV